jgi:hypothetical protein
MGNVQAVQAKVQQYLADNFSNVSLFKANEYSLRHGSSRAFVKITSSADDAPTFVTITIPLLFGVPDSPQLHRHIAYHADDWIFGHLCLSQNEEQGQADIFFNHMLLGDYIDEAELAHAVGGMISTSDRLDDELQSQFGGTKFHED